MLVVTYLVSLISLLNLHLVLSAKDDTSNALPSLWPAIRADKSYRIMYQLQMQTETSDVDQVERLVVEEWASFDKQLFRLDLIANGLRTTYLTYGKKGEVFEYKPFVCNLLDAADGELGVLGNLFKGYSFGLNGTLAYGLGPLWLSSSQNASSTISMDSKSKAFRRHQFLIYIFDGYEISFEGAKIPYNLRMYFPNSIKDPFVDVVEWLSSLNGSESQKLSDPSRIKARAKLMYIDHSPIEDSIFDLPLGYGCQRKNFDDRHSDVKIGIDFLEDANPAKQASLEITTSRPRDELMSSWASQKTTVYLLHGFLNTGNLMHTYYVARTQGIGPKTSQIQRIKRVWWAHNSTSSEAMTYEIDEVNGDCQTTRMSIKDLVKIPFPETEFNSNITTSQSLNIYFVSSILRDDEGYHRVREEISFNSSSYREVFFEKRIDQFEMRDSDNKLIWTGPISIVKRIKSVAIFFDQEDPFLSQFTTVSVFFFSHDKTTILYKAVIDLLGHEEVDFSFMQQEVDVGACFGPNQKEEILIKYPMESQDLARTLSSIEDSVKAQFLLNLSNVTSVQPLQVSGLKLSFDNFFMYIKMTLIELPLTHIFDMKKGLQLKVKEGDLTSKTNIKQMIVSGVEKCADYCDFDGCFRFSYDFAGRKCTLELRNEIGITERRDSSDLYHSDDIFSLNTPRPWSQYNGLGHRPHMKLGTILQLFQDYLSFELTDKTNYDHILPSGMMPGSNNVPLRFRIGVDLLPRLVLEELDYIELRPISVHSNIDSMNEFVREEQTDYTTSQMVNSSIVTIHEDSNLRLQYNILFEGRQFEKKIGRAHKGLLSFENCRDLCESNDCRSFSYCESEEYCTVTDLHDTTAIKRASFSNSLCSVHILDYLSKFEDFGSTRQPTVAKSIIKVSTREDCALACMEKQDFNCQGFYHCRKPEADDPDYARSSSCILQDKHIEEGGSDAEHPPNFELFTDSKSRIICNYFSRSYLAQFDVYVDKGLRFFNEEGVGFEMVMGLGAEGCAKKCIQESCLAFHIYSNVCELAYRQIKKNNIVPRLKFTTFVLSDKSQFNRMKMKLTDDASPNREALDKNDDASNVVVDSEQQEASKKDIFAQLFEKFWSLEEIERMKEGSHLVWKVISLLAGSILGVVCAIIWVKKDSVYNIVTSINDRYRTMR